MCSMWTDIAHRTIAYDSHKPHNFPHGWKYPSSFGTSTSFKVSFAGHMPIYVASLAAAIVRTATRTQLVMVQHLKR